MIIKKHTSSGSALLIVLALAAFLIPLIQGAWLDTQLEYKFRRYRMSELQARYNAQSGTGLSLLRLYIYTGVRHALPKSFANSKNVRTLLDQIWNFPFAYPLNPNEDMLKSEKATIQDINKRAFFKGSYSAEISPENGKLDIHDLVSPLPYLRKFVYASLFQLLTNLIQDREDLKDIYQASDIREILDDLTHFVHVDTKNGASANQDTLNRSFISIEEIQKAPKMTSQIYRLLKPYITVHGAKSLNINYASAELLQALNIPILLIKELSLLRGEDPDSKLQSQKKILFINSKQFCDFMQGMGAYFCEDLKKKYDTLDMLSFSYPLAFRIKSDGKYKKNHVQTSSLLQDLSMVSLAYQKLRQKALLREKNQNQQQALSPKLKKSNSQQQNLKLDYSYYKSMIIMYVKQNFINL